jgi:uncharacterized protein YndB with AHSA1/START domain
MTTPSRNGSFTIEGDQAVMTFHRRLPYPVADVWAASTDPERREQWLGETVIDAHQGGTHAFFDRLEALLADEPLPNWQERYNEVAPSYA